MMTPLSNSDYTLMTALWERSVRVSHEFLSEEDIAEIRKELPTYFDAVELRGWRDQTGRLLGFIGIAGNNIEMLFIDADSHGQGIGRTLFEWARRQGVVKVDVNEQNPTALQFYRHLGFVQVSRSETDGEGRPFPVIHLEIKQR